MALLTNAKIGEHYRTRNGLIATLYAIRTGCERNQYIFYVCGQALTYDEVLERVFSSDALNSRRKMCTYDNGMYIEGMESENDIINKI